MATQSRTSLRGSVVVFVAPGYRGKKFVFEKAKELGVRSVIIDSPDSWCTEMVKEDLVERYIPMDLSQGEDILFTQCLAVIEHVRDDLRAVDGVVTFCEMLMPLATRLCEALGLPGNTRASVDLARDKHATRKKMQESGLPSPRCFLINSPSQLREASKLVGFPAVVKPCFGAASIGVMRVDDLDELKSSYARVVKDMSSCRMVSGCLEQGNEGETRGMNASLWMRPAVMLEEYLDGSEVDVDLVFQDGKSVYHAISDNWPTVEPWFNETGSNMPSILPGSQQRELVDFAIQSVLCLGFTLGVFHVECKYTSRGPRLIEVNCRMGGGPIRLINLLVWGVDLVVEQLRCSVGIRSQISPAKKPLVSLAEFSVNAKKSGILRDVNYLTPYQERKDVLYARALVPAGGKVVCAKDGLPTWVCELLVSKPTVHEAIEYVTAIEAEIQNAIVVEPFAPRVNLNLSSHEESSSTAIEEDRPQNEAKSLRGAVIVFIAAGVSSQRFLFERAKALGVRSIAIDSPDSWVKSLVTERIIERFLAEDMSSEKVFENCLEKIQGIRREFHGLDGVMTFSEFMKPLSSRLCSALGVPPTNPVLASLLLDKHAMQHTFGTLPSEVLLEGCHE